MGANKSNPDQYQLRFPVGMRERLKAAAEANGRSMNSEIILRLRAALDRQDDGSISVWLPPDVLDRIYDEANRNETDPNLLILEAVEAKYPPKPSIRDYLREIADELSADGKPHPEARALLAQLADVLSTDDEPSVPRWKAPKS